MQRSGTADLPLHGGSVPKWLADRMTLLGTAIAENVVHHYGTGAFLSRLSDPFWFQALGSVMGMDWHSSGITTSVLGALKRGLAFVVTDPHVFFKDYNVPVREEMAQELKLTDPAHLQVFVICNKVGEWLTGNLLGPIVVNAENCLAQQIVLTEKKWTTRQPLIRMGVELPLAKSA